MIRKLIAAIAALVVIATPALADDVHGLWIWDGAKMVASPAEQDRLLAAAPALQLTDIYLALAPSDYRNAAPLQQFIGRMSANSIKVWGLDGCRCYFKDAGGPMGLYRSVDALIRYNAGAADGQRFVGFQTDNEPQDIAGYPQHFHNGIKPSQLSPGQAHDRESLLENWLDIQQTVYALLKSAGLRTGAAMVFFTESYNGEPLMVTYNGVRANVGHMMMSYTDDYVVMSYNTDPANAASRVAGQAAFASRLPADIRPRILAAMETDKGVESGVSYGDTPGKTSRDAVLADRAAISRQLQVYPAFAGVSIHAWTGWSALSK